MKINEENDTHYLGWNATSNAIELGSAGGFLIVVIRKDTSRVATVLSVDNRVVIMDTSTSEGD